MSLVFIKPHSTSPGNTTTKAQANRRRGSHCSRGTSELKRSATLFQCVYVCVCVGGGGGAIRGGVTLSRCISVFADSFIFSLGQAFGKAVGRE